MVFEVKWYGLSQSGSLLLHKGVSRAPSSFLISLQLLASALPFVSPQPFICLHSKHDQFADLLDAQSKKKRWGRSGDGEEGVGLASKGRSLLNHIV